MDQKIIKQAQEWHDDLIRDLRANVISPREANIKVVEKMAEWIGGMTYEPILSSLCFKNNGMEYNTMKPFFYQVILNNKVIEMLRSLKTDSPEEVQDTINKHYDDMLSLFQYEYPIQQRFEWTYGVNPRLSKLYRKLKFGT